MSDDFRLVVPSLDHLPSYRAALEAGWSAANIDGERARLAELALIDADAAAFVRSLDDPARTGRPNILLDGTTRPRLPGYRRWMWDGEFCGSIGLRWQPGTSELPSCIHGHVGFAVVPWKRGNGHAARALALLLPDARAKGLPYLEITADEDNPASRRTIERCGGVLVGRFTQDAACGGGETLRYRIDLSA